MKTLILITNSLLAILLALPKRYVCFPLCVFFLYGCGVLYDDGSSYDFKQRLVGSFLINASELFYPNHERNLASRNTLSASEQKKLTEFIQGNLHNLVLLYNHHYDADVEVPDFRLVNKNEAIAEATDDNVVIDVSVLQTIYEATIYDTANLGSNSLIIPEQDRLHFLDNKKSNAVRTKLIESVNNRLREIKEYPAYPFTYQDEASLDKLGEKAPIGFFFSVGLAMEDINNNFTTALVFLLAHELAHTILNHNERIASEIKSGKEECRTLYGIEVEADIYASEVVELLGQYQSQYFSRHRSTLGYKSFFHNIYKQAGFVDGLEGNCSYPKPTIRDNIISTFEGSILSVDDREKIWQYIMAEYDKGSLDEI